MGGLTMGMLLSIPMVLIGLGLVAWARSRPPRAPKEPVPS